MMVALVINKNNETNISPIKGMMTLIMYKYYSVSFFTLIKKYLSNISLLVDYKTIDVK